MLQRVEPGRFLEAPQDLGLSSYCSLVKNRVGVPESSAAMAVSLLRLPALDMVKGFVAVGRRMSITQAAEDLCVTQSAMSKQIRTLEEALGIRLFQRGYRSISFTAEGEQLFRMANTSIQQLQDAFHVVGNSGKRPVTITASIGVTSLWLLPRLGDFQRGHPGIDVRVAASNAVLDLAKEGIDLAIRYCSGADAPRGSRHLFAESIAPVASPLLGVQRVDSKAALKNHVLLEYEDRRRWLTWADWLSSRGLTTDMARGVLRFNQYDQAIQAAVAGQGVALGRLELLDLMLQERRLEVLAQGGDALRTHYGYFLVRPDDTSGDEVSQVFDWIVETLQASPKEDAGPCVPRDRKKPTRTKTPADARK